MIDPLRPYWPTNRSIAGLLARSACLLAAGAAVTFGSSRSFVIVVVLVSAFAQASLLSLEWMELKRTQRPGLIVASVVGFLFLALVVVLVLESRSVLVLSVR
jgi:heme/copper-type cytochrome/quinol oxidase subunit 4